MWNENGFLWHENISFMLQNSVFYINWVIHF
nr:MAG TPA: hypothetical protein [Caudoviricetes sp.]